MDIKLLQLSDTHLHQKAGKRLIGIDTDASMRAVVELAASEEDVTAILATGDLSQDGSIESYQRCNEILQALGAPIHWLPGNHDDVHYFHQAVKDFPFAERQTLDLGNWRIILLDSVVPGEDIGRLAQAELDYLSDQLADSAGRHCLVALHHQVVATGAEWLDTMQLENNKEFMEILQQQANVRVVIYGHVHQEFTACLDGIRLLSVPSTCFQFKPDSEGFALDDNLPGYRCMILKETGEIVTEIRRLKDFNMEPDWGILGY